MTVMVEIPRFALSEIGAQPENGNVDTVHPAFIGPDGTILDSIKLEMEDWEALLVLRNLRNIKWKLAKELLANSRDEYGLLNGWDLDRYDRLTGQIRMLGNEVKKLEDEMYYGR